VDEKLGSRPSAATIPGFYWTINFSLTQPRPAKIISQAAVCLVCTIPNR